MNHVVHNTCTVLGRNIKTRYFGLILILRFGKDWQSIRLDRMQSSFKEYFPAYCIPKVVRLKIDGDMVSRKTWSVFKHVHLKTVRVSMLSRLMIDQGDLEKTQLQYKTTLKFFMRPNRSTLTMRHSVKELRRTWTSKFQDHHVPLWNTRKVPAFDNWFRKLRTTQIDMLFNRIYDRINH